MASQLSGVRPNAFERRKAISGLTPLLPFNTRLNVEVATGQDYVTPSPVVSIKGRVRPDRLRAGGFCGTRDKDVDMSDTGA